MHRGQIRAATAPPRSGAHPGSKMTSQRLLLLSSVGMLFAATAAYMLAPAPQSRPAIAQVPFEPTVTPSASVEATATVSSGSARSQPPTAKEWSTAPEVEVEGARELNCSTRKLREWLRVACTSTGDINSEPIDVRVLGARHLKTDPAVNGIVHTAWRAPVGAIYTAAGGDLISLVCPFVEGIALKVRFEWSDKNAVLAVSWPTGMPEPLLKGSFTRSSSEVPR